MSIDISLLVQSPRELVPYAEAAAPPRVLVDERTEEELTRACFKEMRRMQRRLNRLERTTVRLEQTSGRAEQRLIEVIQGYPAVLQSVNDLRQGMDELSQETREWRQRVEILSSLSSAFPLPIGGSAPSPNEPDAGLVNSIIPTVLCISIMLTASYFGIKKVCGHVLQPLKAKVSACWAGKTPKITPTALKSSRPLRGKVHSREKIAQSSVTIASEHLGDIQKQCFKQLQPGNVT